MTIKELLQSVAELVRPREIIDHEGCRMIPDALDMPDLLARWNLSSVDELYHAEIGDLDLWSAMEALVDNDDEIASLDMWALRRLIQAYNGPDLADYVTQCADNQLAELDELIAAAHALF